MTDQATPTLKPCTDAIEVTQADREQQGWLWLDDMVSSTSDETAADLFYTADQMVDAYIAGAATQAAEIARLREALAWVRNNWDNQDIGHAIYRVQANLKANAALSAQPNPADGARRYLIIKNGMYYRPNARGYTCSVADAGRYTLEEAISHSHPNGPDGPRDGISYKPVPNCAARPSEQEGGE